MLYSANFEDEIGALDSHLRLRHRDDAALRPCERTRDTVDLLHERDRDAIAMFADGAADILSLIMSTYRSKDRYEKIARFFGEDDKPVRQYTSWAPTINLTEHLIANEALGGVT